MAQNYQGIQREYLEKAWARPGAELESALPARAEGGGLHFQAFGEECALSREEATLAGAPATGPEGLLVAMYANYAKDLPVKLHPLKSFKEMPDSMPYHGPFHANAERILVAHVPAIRIHAEEIAAKFSGCVNSDAMSGDFSFTLYPLPRIPLYYIFNLEDDEFPASAICLFAANAIRFMPLDGLADVAEYTARRMIAFANGKERMGGKAH